MKNFFKIVLANIVAIVVVCAALFFFFILMIVIGSLGSSDSTKIKENSVLTLSHKIEIIDSPTQDRESFVFPSKDAPQKVMLYDLLEAIKQAKTDDKIKGINIEADYLSAGITQLDNVRAALEDFKKSGKFVYAYGNNVSQSAYYLGSVADQYYLNPMGGVDLKGLSTQVVFIKDFAEKYGIGLEVIRHGKFKAAVEPFIRNDISPENEEQLSTLLNDIWGKTSSAIYTSRKISANDLKVFADSLYGMIPENVVKYKLADKLLQKSEYDNLLKSKAGVKDSKKLNKVSFAKYINSLKKEKESSDKIAVLYANGGIENGEGYEDIHAVDYVKYIKDLQEDKKVKAVVLRINSPGGSANASDEILFELNQLKTKKPIVVSFGDYAASGGYYIAMAADKIYSEPNTLTGSIGVFGMLPNVENLAKKNGIRADVVQTNENSNYFSLLHGVTPTGKEMITKSVEGTYKRFVHFVTQNRKKTFEEIDAVGGGRVWSGTKAKEIGLVDELGTLNDAISYAAEKAKLKNYSVKSYPKKLSFFEELFSEMESDGIAAKILERKIGKENYEIIKEIEKNNGDVIKMQMPYRISIK
ncbi:MAG: signal peptide peptidase SppA [Cruoricaptor ignavus]|nr:signal peptide peptidase SppA [Cruoricaptor ignavus]